MGFILLGGLEGVSGPVHQPIIFNANPLEILEFVSWDLVFEEGDLGDGQTAESAVEAFHLPMHATLLKKFVKLGFISLRGLHGDVEWIVLRFVYIW